MADFGGSAAEDLEERGADFHGITVIEKDFLGRKAIDLQAIGTAPIRQDRSVRRTGDAGVHAGNETVVEDDLIRGGPADHDVAVRRQIENPVIAGDEEKVGIHDQPPGSRFDAPLDRRH